MEDQPEITPDISNLLTSPNPQLQEIGQLAIQAWTGDLADELITRITSDRQAELQAVQDKWDQQLHRAEMAKRVAGKDTKDNLEQYDGNLINDYKAGKIGVDALIYGLALSWEGRTGSALDFAAADQTLRRFHSLVPGMPVLTGYFDQRISDSTQSLQYIKITHSGILLASPQVSIDQNNQFMMDLKTQDGQLLKCSLFGQQQLAIGSTEVEAIAETWLDWSLAEFKGLDVGWPSGPGSRLGPIEDSLNRLTTLKPLQLQTPQYQACRDRTVEQFRKVVSTKNLDYHNQLKIIDILPLMAQLSPDVADFTAQNLYQSNNPAVSQSMVVAYSRLKNPSYDSLTIAQQRRVKSATRGALRLQRQYLYYDL